MTLNPKESRLEECLSEIFKYCREHKGSCEGCIFFRKITIANITMGVCRVLDAPDVFGYRRNDSDVDDDT